MTDKYTQFRLDTQKYREEFDRENKGLYNSDLEELRARRLFIYFRLGSYTPKTIDMIFN